VILRRHIDPKRAAWLFVPLVLALLLVRPAEAFQRYGGGPAVRQSAGLTLAMPSFRPTSQSCAIPDQEGGCTEFADFTFDNPIVGLFYSRQGIQLFIGRGVQGDVSNVGDLEFLETVIDVYGAARPFQGGSDAALEFYLPFGLHSDYRRVSSQTAGSTADQFEATTIAIGGGAGLMSRRGHTRFSFRVMPHIGLASRSLGFGNGTTALLDSDAELTFGPIRGRFGLSFGYQFRWQRWNMESDFVASRDYEATQHVFRMGIFW
jgi:hypothetical protein